MTPRAEGWKLDGDPSVDEAKSLLRPRSYLLIMNHRRPLGGRGAVAAAGARRGRRRRRKDGQRGVLRGDGDGAGRRRMRHRGWREPGAVEATAGESWVFGSSGLSVRTLAQLFSKLWSLESNQPWSTGLVQCGA